MEVKNEGGRISCNFRTSPAAGLSLGAAIVLLLAHIVIHAISGFRLCRKGPRNPGNTLVKAWILFLFSWLTLTLLLTSFLRWITLSLPSNFICIYNFTHTHNSLSLLLSHSETVPLETLYLSLPRSHTHTCSLLTCSHSLSLSHAVTCTSTLSHFLSHAHIFSLSLSLSLSLSMLLAHTLPLAYSQKLSRSLSFQP